MSSKPEKLVLFMPSLASVRLIRDVTCANAVKFRAVAIQDQTASRLTLNSGGASGYPQFARYH